MTSDQRTHALIHCKERDLAAAVRLAELEELCWARDKAKEKGLSERADILHRYILQRLN